jgi:hypothetical protein
MSLISTKNIVPESASKVSYFIIFCAMVVVDFILFVVSLLLTSSTVGLSSSKSVAFAGRHTFYPNKNIPPYRLVVDLGSVARFSARFCT